MFAETPDLIQALVQEGTGTHADVFKRVSAAYPYGVRFGTGTPATRWSYDSARASTTRSTQPEERRARNAPNSPSRAKRRRHDADIRQTVRKLVLSGFLRGVGDLRIAHDPHRWIRTGPASVVAGGC
jgi:hypothetical protein